LTREARDQDHVCELCPGAKFHPLIGALACTHGDPRIPFTPKMCLIVLSPDALRTAGFPLDLAVRHETAHCNGWPADHKGALPFEPPVLNAASQFDEFAFNAVRKTVAEVAKNLALNDKRAARFVVAAKGIGLAPESKITGEMLTDPATAAPLARAAGIGTNLSDDQWRLAHALAVLSARARQAEKAATKPQ
jgi:hypothetical protein